MQLRRDTWRFVSRGTSFPFKVSPPCIFIPLRIALLFSITSIIFFFFLICIRRVLIDLIKNWISYNKLFDNFCIFFFFLNRGIDSRIKYNVFSNFIIVGICIRFGSVLDEGLSTGNRELRALYAIFFIVDSLFFSNNGIFIRWWYITRPRDVVDIINNKRDSRINGLGGERDWKHFLSNTVCFSKTCEQINVVNNAK